MEAIRFTGEAVDRESTEAVSLSLWLYDENDDLIDHRFTSGKLVPEVQGTQWKPLNGRPEGIPIPRRRLGKGDRFTFQIKLNPNRLLTPPDAVFIESVDLSSLLTGDLDQKQLLITSTNKLFELRVVFSASRPRSPK
jgi:hypothetical protein